MSLIEQIRRAQLELGWSDSELLEKSGLKFDRTNLLRRLNGKTRSSLAECEALAAAIRTARPNFELQWCPSDQRVTG